MRITERIDSVILVESEAMTKDGTVATHSWPVTAMWFEPKLYPLFISQ